MPARLPLPKENRDQLRDQIKGNAEQADAFGGGWFNEFAQRFRKFTTNPISALQGIEESRTPMMFLRSSPLQLVKTGHSSLRRINGYGPYGGFEVGQSIAVSEVCPVTPSAVLSNYWLGIRQCRLVQERPLRLILRRSWRIQNFPSLDSVYFSCVTSGTVGDNQNLPNEFDEPQAKDILAANDGDLKYLPRLPLKILLWKTGKRKINLKGFFGRRSFLIRALLEINARESKGGNNVHKGIEGRGTKYRLG
ncbi:hypothetical protein B0H13DRAFT_1924157 [Mycena leptocephala]|nr:hypothetical protein B0H13DRAFT_1924157 [Mycena leptocephala]